MHHRTKALLSAALICLSFSSSFSQSFKDRFYQSTGWSAFLDYFKMPTFLEDNSYAANPAGLSMVTYFYKPRVNLYDFNENTSIDLHAIPALGLSYASTNGGEAWLGSISLPVMAGFNFGNISTYDTKQNHGFGIGVGMEYFNGGLFIVNKSTSASRVTGVFQPAMELCYRYWSKSNKAKELSLFAGFKGKGASDLVQGDPDLQGENISGSWHFRFAWSTYIDY